MDEQQFYLTLDTSFTIDLFRTEVAYLKNSWKGVGRPTLTLAISHSLLGRSKYGLNHQINQAYLLLCENIMFLCYFHKY